MATETCSGCNVARYCSQFCQHKDWESHHKVCSIAKKSKGGNNNSTVEDSIEKRKKDHDDGEDHNGDVDKEDVGSDEVAISVDS